MTTNERQAWTIVACLFVTLFLVTGTSSDSQGLFVTPLAQHFGWSRAAVSLLYGSYSLTHGMSGLVVGWLLDRIDAKRIMTVGAGLVGIGLVEAALAHSYVPILLAYLLIGIGASLSTTIPAAVVTTNWFGANRGTALGIALAGTSVGGMVMTLVGQYAISSGGWRAGYFTFAAPIFLIVLPFVLLVIRTRPTDSERINIAETTRTLSGLEVGEALRNRSFWAVTFVAFVYSVAGSGMTLHLIPYLRGAGYSAAQAALAMSVWFGLTSCGKFFWGMIADRVTGRVALALNLVSTASGLSLLVLGHSGLMVIVFVALFGLNCGVPVSLLPLVLVEAVGLKAYGTLSGCMGVAFTLGGGVGPLFAGRVFDVTGSYEAAFITFIAAFVTGSVVSLASTPMWLAPDVAPSAAN